MLSSEKEEPGGLSIPFLLHIIERTSRVASLSYPNRAALWRPGLTSLEILRILLRVSPFPISLAICAHSYKISF